MGKFKEQQIKVQEAFDALFYSNFNSDKEYYKSLIVIAEVLYKEGYINQVMIYD